MFKFFMFFILMCLMSTVCLADNSLRQFAMMASSDMNVSECALTERASVNSNSQFKFAGIVNELGCQVSISKSRYESLFQFCFLSGISLYKTLDDNSQECFVQERDNDYWFVTQLSGHLKKESQIMCYFSCIVR